MGRPFSFWDHVLDSKRQQQKSRGLKHPKPHATGSRDLGFEQLEPIILLTADSLVVTFTNADFNENNTINAADLSQWVRFLQRTLHHENSRKKMVDGRAKRISLVCRAVRIGIGHCLRGLSISRVV